MHSIELKQEKLNLDRTVMLYAYWILWGGLDVIYLPYCRIVIDVSMCCLEKEGVSSAPLVLSPRIIA